MWRAAFLCIWAATSLWAQDIRLATWNVGLVRQGPGLLLEDIEGGKDPQIIAVIEGLGRLNADIVLLTAVDFDRRHLAIQALLAALRRKQIIYPYYYAAPPNSGVPTGFDLDDNGRTGGARDAMGYGRFAGQGGMVLLSRWPVMAGQAQDHTSFLWADVPNSLIVPNWGDDRRAALRLSSVNHWQVPVLLPDGRNLHVMAFAATPPVFDGAEDRNGRRNHDEIIFWPHLLNGNLPFAPPAGPFVIMGDSNLDPMDGDGRRAAMAALLTHPLIQDLRPQNNSRHHDAAHQGDDRFDTAIYPKPGGLRLDYVLPSRDITVTGSGVLWPAPDDPLAAILAKASHHYPVWVDMAVK